MNERDRQVVESVLSKGDPRPDVAILFLVQAVLNLHNVVDALAYEIEANGQTALLGNAPHKHAAELGEVREQLSAAIKMSMGTHHG